jgi:hypothetical protein
MKTPLKEQSKFKVEKTPYWVFKTQDYEMFKPLTGNRNVNILHVKRLIQSFQVQHLISVVIVNERYEVIDGQHRKGLEENRLSEDVLRYGPRALQAV